MFCFLDVAIISILAYSGVPSNCIGLTSSEDDDNDSSANSEDVPQWAKEYNTTGFSNRQDNTKGKMDRYCGMERAFYFIAIAVMCVYPLPHKIVVFGAPVTDIKCSLTYLISIILLVLRVCELKMIPKDKVDQMLQEREEMINLEHKIHDQEALSATPTHNMTPVMPQGNRDFGATNTHPNTHHFSTPRTTRDTTASSSTRPARPQLRYADPMAGPSSSSSSSSYRTPQHPTDPVSPITPVSPLSTAAAALPHDRGFILSATDVSANLAMVADGPRYSPPQADHNQLPPYSPGNNNNARATMRGHGGESNDIRLSEYVKGATAAQDLKDSNGF
ncbi:hypothetical protein Daus18300_008417 [Diaporthe australafricana]|uniref:Uncharacterized protein n=1 Tax=Diaporthe australafricana TaxID=127596 RepID=A0ABR3WIX6_9PEZI